MTRKVRRLILLGGLTSAWCGWSQAVMAAAPEISDPDGHLQAGQEPGAYPSTVTAANIDITPIPTGELNGSGQNNLKVTFPSAGPIKWTESRHNEGDIALLIGPKDPNDPSYFPPADFFDDYKPTPPDTFENTTLAWRTSRTTGALLATVRHNGVDQGITASGQPMGVMHGVAYFNSGFGQGWGFRMDDGVYANGGGNSTDLQMGVAGNDDGAGEASFNVATAYFPYEQGWWGAWVGPASDTVANISAGSPDLPEESVTWFAPTGEILDGAVGRVEFPGINSATDGMLFVSATNSDNNTRIAAGMPREGGWDIAIREDNDSDVTGGTLVSPEKSDYQFLYVPYTAGNLIGGHVLGNGTVQNAAGSSRFNLARTAEGQYAVTVLGTDGTTKLADDDGMLILSVAGQMDGPTGLPDRSFMSYEYDEASGSFVVQARQLTATGSPASQNVFGDLLSLTDTDFYFAFVDFNNPLSPTAASTPGDFDNDGQLTAADIDLLTTAVRAGNNPASFDLNADNAVNATDRQVWVESLKKSYFGDANLDGEFNTTDFVFVFQAGQYEDATNGNSTWATGDWNGDGDFNTGDFVEAFQRGGYEQGPRAAVSAVPEPASASLLVLTGLGLAGLVRRRR